MLIDKSVSRVSLFVSVLMRPSFLAKLSVWVSYRLGYAVNSPTFDHCRRDFHKFRNDHFMRHARDAVVFHLERHSDRRRDPTLACKLGELLVDFVRRCAGGDSFR